MKFIIFPITVLFLFVLAGCKDASNTEKQGKAEGAKAAIDVINTIGKSDMTMEEAILDAKAKQSKYLKNDAAAAKEFDTAFRKYIKTNNDSLAKKIF